MIFAANLAASAVIPVDFDATREQFDSLWVMSPVEILRLPMKIWAGNLGMIADYIGAYYSWVVGLFYSACVWLAIRRRDFAEIALVLMCLAGGGAIIFFLRGFNEYMLNTAVVAVLLPSLAQGAVVMWDLFRGKTARLARGGLLVATAVTASIWCRQMVLMATTPGAYFEQSTKWAAANYLTSWPTGFGIKELVAMLEKEPGPGVIFADPQWGNPRTALQVYARRFPKLRVVPVTAEFTDAAKRRELRDIARTMGPTRLLIFSAGAASARGEMWTRDAEREMCDTRTEIKAWPRQMPIVVCRF